MAMRLHRSVAGAPNAPPMLFIHPNPMDGSCWLFQIAHLSTWFRCVAVDLPGYGLSPAVDHQFDIHDVALACWAALDDEADLSRPAVLIGCSVGATLTQYMHDQRPQDTAALVLSGTGYYPTKSFAAARREGYERLGLGYRSEYALENFSDGFARGATARWYVGLLSERNSRADLATILRLVEAMAVPDPIGLQQRVAVPTLLLRGSEDAAYDHAEGLARLLRDCKLVTLDGAGHACFMEQPDVFDAYVVEFLRAHHLLADRPPTADP